MSKPIVLTLDAGGTNMVFSAMQAGKFITEPYTVETRHDNLELMIKGLIKGFETVKKRLSETPAAISFAFPGPADYRRGIIGDLPNFPAFRGGVPLKPILENHFDLPVYINNDGHLYAYGEALAGALPYYNHLIAKDGGVKRFRNLIGLTLGTGFGCGVVRDQRLFMGDNTGTEAWIMGTKYSQQRNAEEEGVAIRAVVRKYKEFTGTDGKITPKDIFEIASGKQDGKQQAAQRAFAYMGSVLGDAIANLIALFDGLLVIGGGVAGAKEFIIPAMFDEIRMKWQTYTGDSFCRTTQKVYNLHDPAELKQFIHGKPTKLKVYGTNKQIDYDREPRTGVCFSSQDASQTISLGAYHFALNRLKNK